LKKALDVVIDKFEKTYKVDIVPNYGPSGGFYTQITLGQPFDIYFSADFRFIDKLEKDGLLAEGKKFISDFVVVIVSATGAKKIKSFDDLDNDGVVLSIADPRAPVLGDKFSVMVKGRLSQAVSTEEAFDTIKSSII